MFTKELADGSLVTEVLIDEAVAKCGHAAEQTHTVPHLSLPPTSTSAAMETLTLAKEGLGSWYRGRRARVTSSLV